MDFFNFFKHFRLFKNNGFSLLEVLIVASISIFITMNLLSSVLRSKVDLDEVARILIADIRTAQANALASKQYIDPSTGVSSDRCGYGIHQNDGTSYFIYVGRFPAGSGCNPNNWKYNVTDTPVVFTRILDSRIEFFDPNGATRPNFEDVSFEPSSGRIRIDNQHNPTNQNQNRSQIVIRKIGVTCPSADCAYICVYSFGRIESRSDECPALNGP